MMLSDGVPICYCVVLLDVRNEEVVASLMLLIDGID
jgi:hypothetical protein